MSIGETPAASAVQAPAPITGVELAGATAGLKASGRPDVALVRLAPGSRTAAVFTRNAFCAAPVLLARAHLGASDPRLLLINSGCANAGTGAAGDRDAQASCEHAASVVGVSAHAVLPFSTGVIGQRLDLDRLYAGIDTAAGALSEHGWAAAAEAILTTDTVAKMASSRVALAGGEVTITGMAKGSGMIRPNMATMLGFVATDAQLDGEAVDALLRAAVARSFHCITVDGDTSTNDAVTLSATGASGVGAVGADEHERLGEAITAVCIELAQAIVRDAEGATRFAEIVVEGGRDEAECREVAFTVAQSPLVKTALFGGDPNWGRILAAIGRAGLADLDIAGVDIALGDLPIVAGGQPRADYDEARAAGIMQRDEVRIGIALGRGAAATRVWTSDLSYDYVRINADYRT
ncbi:MAG: bifunctional glutamate N-acetyltransferase/amino-acid acetyltransferase ArgJ [Halofilum sp. (in: g-proteobacteria)]